jgi:hypothetical protein
MSCGSTGLFWPRCAVVMNARPLANTMSRGSSPTSNVLVTRGGDDATSTMLTLSERWFTTHTSASSRNATAHGSSPTGTEARCVSVPTPTAKTSS